MLPKKRIAKYAKRKSITTRMKRRSNARRVEPTPQPPHGTILVPEYVSASEAAVLTGIPNRTLENMRSKRMGPPYLKIGSSVRYPLGDLRAWMQSHLVQTVGGAQ